MRTISVILIAGLSLSCLWIKDSHYVYKVYYFPMFSHADAMDSKIIEDQYDLTSISQKAVPRILDILKGSKTVSKKFQSNLVRLKIEDGKETYLVDLVGNVKVGEKISRISEEEKKQVRKLLFDQFPDH